jgi:hypothetical protein
VNRIEFDRQITVLARYSKNVRHKKLKNKKGWEIGYVFDKYDDAGFHCSNLTVSYKDVLGSYVHDYSQEFDVIKEFLK